MQPPIQIAVLGHLEVKVNGQVLKVKSERERTVLAMLALNRGRPVSDELLIDAVWGERPPRTVRNQLAICVSTLRKLAPAAEGPFIERVAPGYALRVQDCEIDLDVAKEGIRRARAAQEAKRHLEAIREFRSVLDLWRGPALSNVGSDLVEMERRHLDEWHTSIKEECLGLEVASGQYRETISELTELVTDAPYREEPRSLLMRALHGAGRKADALRVFEEGRRFLQEELGLDPGTELRKTHEMVLRDEVTTLVTTEPERPESPWGAERSFSAAEHGWQVHQLPPAPAGFQGRDVELRQLFEEFELRSRAGLAPCVMVTGMGGVGKTTFATHAAHRLCEEYPDGQLYIDLQGFTEGTEALSASEALDIFLRSLGVPKEYIPDALEARSSLFRTCLTGRRMLLLLDNASRSDQIRALLPGTTDCAVIITSRNHLSDLSVLFGVGHIRLSTLDREGAIAVLREALDTRTHKDDDLDRVAELCDGLPLALRIVAARVGPQRGWSLSTVVRRLTDEQRRLSELNQSGVNFTASLSMSYDTLSPTAARLLSRISLLNTPEFPDWCAAALLNTDVLDGQDILQELIDAHLIEVVGEDELGLIRYRTHDLVRLYVKGKAGADSEEERSAAVFRVLHGWLCLAEDAYRRESGDGQFALRGNFERWVPSGTDSGEIQKDPLRWLLVERRSLSSAIYQSVTLGDDELAWHLALLAKRAYAAHSRFDEWRQTHEHVLDATRASGNRRGEAAILHSLAQLSSVSRPGDEGWRTLDLLTEALTTFTEIGDGQGRGVTLLEMAKEQRRSGEIDAALDSCRLAQRLLREAGDGTTEALALHEEADLLRRSGRIREAQASVIELRRQERDLPPRLHPLLLRQTARLYMEQGRLDDATEALTQALDLVQASGDVAGRASLFHLLGRVAWRTGAVDDAQSHLDQAMKLSQQVGIRSFYEQAAWSLERVLAGLDPSDPSPPK